MTIILILILAYVILGVREWYAYTKDSPLSNLKEFGKMLLVWPLYMAFRKLF